MTANTVIKPVACLTSLLWATLTFAQTEPLRDQTNTAFQRGEQLTYRIHYGIIDAATATIKIDDEAKIVDGRSTFHVVGTGDSKGAFNLFFKVHDRYETYIDDRALCPVMFIRRVDEGGFKIKQDLVFDQQYHVINSNGKEFNNMPAYIQDMLSAFYFARTFSYSDEKPGKLDSVVCFVDDEVWYLKMKFIKYDVLNSDVGKIKCMVFEPLVQKGRVFKKSEDLQVWITDDKNHIPIRAQANILFGSIKMDLESYSGIVQEFDKQK
jgi:hypothetical protein